MSGIYSWFLRVRNKFNPLRWGRRWRPRTYPTGPGRREKDKRKWFADTDMTTLSDIIDDEIQDASEAAKTMTPDEVEMRLQCLRNRYGMTDEEAIAKAIHGSLRIGLDGHVWLILTGRGDLLP